MRSRRLGERRLRKQTGLPSSAGHRRMRITCGGLLSSRRGYGDTPDTPIVASEKRSSGGLLAAGYRAGSYRTRQETANLSDQGRVWRHLKDAGVWSSCSMSARECWRSYPASLRNRTACMELRVSLRRRTCYPLCPLSFPCFLSRRISHPQQYVKNGVEGRGGCERYVPRFICSTPLLGGAGARSQHHCAATPQDVLRMSRQGSAAGGGDDGSQPGEQSSGRARRASPARPVGHASPPSACSPTLLPSHPPP